MEAALSTLSTMLLELGETKASGPLQVAILNEMGEIHAARQELTQAAACFEKSLARDPAQSTVSYRLGLVYRDLGNPRKAAVQFEFAIEHGFRNSA
jgi:tetratricopeptide (TPR) repeat protein